MLILKAAVVGAGTMGGGIAYVISAAGVPVLVKDIDAGQLDLARAHVEGIYRRQVERGRMTPAESQKGLSLVQYTLSDEGLDEVRTFLEGAMTGKNTGRWM